MKKILRKIDVDGSWGSIDRHPYCSFDHDWDVMDGVGSCCILTHWSGACELIKLLESTFSLRIGIWSSSNYDHRAFVDHSLCHATNRVCHSRPTHRHTNSGSLRQVPMHASSIRSSLFISKPEVIYFISSKCQCQIIHRNPQDAKHISASLQFQGLSENLVTKNL